METYMALALLCTFVVMLGMMFLAFRNITKVKWQIVLKDDTKFIGKRTLGAMWQEGLCESAYKAVDSLDSSFSEGTIVNLGWATILYRIKVK